MRKIYALLSCAIISLPAMAEEPQLPNAGFQDGWKDCVPWTSNNNTTAEGITPNDWTVSNVIGINIGFGPMGNTTVAENVEGYESTSAVKVANQSIIMNQLVPGYFTLGTTWSTSVMAKENDGGTFGGVAFTGRPEKITFMYKFTRESENEQPANAIAYLWKGTFTQADVPANIVLSGTPAMVNMVNRDRNILGIETAKGGAVTKSEGAELIAKGTTVITEVSAEWVKGEIVFEYLSDATPEMINVIFSANSYFDAANIAAGNALTVDDVQCVYAPAGKEYPGKLSVTSDVLGSIAENVDATILITPTSETTCNFLLPNLTLGDLGTLGDILVENVVMSTDAEGTTTYNGHVDDLVLLGGELHASVDVNGTITAAGKPDFVIDVLWNGIPIKVTFTDGNTSGLTGVVADENAPVEYFNLQGVRVANPENGLYIRRQGSKVQKVLVK